MKLVAAVACALIWSLGCQADDDGSPTSTAGEPDGVASSDASAPSGDDAEVGAGGAQPVAFTDSGAEPSVSGRDASGGQSGDTSDGAVAEDAGSNSVVPALDAALVDVGGSAVGRSDAGLSGVGARRGTFDVAALGSGSGLCEEPSAESTAMDVLYGTVDIWEDADGVHVRFDSFGLPCIDGEEFSAVDVDRVVSFEYPLEPGEAGEAPLRRLSFVFHPDFLDPPPYIGAIQQEVLLEPAEDDPPDAVRYGDTAVYYFALVEHTPAPRE